MLPFINYCRIKKALELAFNTRAGQSYNVVTLQKQIDEKTSELVVSVRDMLAFNISGTNGPTYQYIPGLSDDLELKDLAVEWIGGFVPLAVI